MLTGGASESMLSSNLLISMANATMASDKANWSPGKQRTSQLACRPIVEHARHTRTSSCWMPCGSCKKTSTVHVASWKRLRDVNVCRDAGCGSTDLYTCDARLQKGGKQSFQSAHSEQGHQAATSPHQNHLVFAMSQVPYSTPECHSRSFMDNVCTLNIHKQGEQHGSNQDLWVWTTR